MRKSTRKTIAIIIGNAITNYSTELMEGFQACAREEDVNLVFLTGPHLPRYCRDILIDSFAWDYDYQFHTIYKYVHYIKPDAMIIEYGLLSQQKYVPEINEFVKGFEGIPYLTLGDRGEDENVPFLTGGNYYGMKENLTHLIEDHGYQKIAFVAGPERNFDSNQRMQAYKDAMEEHGLTVEDTYIVHGNYTEMADAEVNWLLDHNPGLEAIVFANDNMAKAGYRVCAERDLVVGHDIAITGYDDGDIAKTLEPQLTSVSHSSFQFSYRAVQAALKLCEGRKPKSEDLPAVYHKRASCGCKIKTYMLKTGLSIAEIKDYTEKRVEAITEELFSAVPYEKDKTKYKMLLELYFSDIVDMVFAGEDTEVTYDVLLRYLKRLCENAFVSKRLLIEYIDAILKELMEFCEDKWKQMTLSTISSAMQQYVHSEEINLLQMDILESDRKNWFIPSFVRDLYFAKMEIKDQMQEVMKRFQAMGIKSAYLLRFAEEVIHGKEEELQYPDTIYLTSYYDETEMVSYNPEDAIPVKWGNGFKHLLPQDRPHVYTAFPIFSGEEVYGMVLCEASQSEYMSMLICSMQLGSLYRITNLNVRERMMQQELEEKNRILSVISVYDELSRLLNRRGFMEKAMDAIKNNWGKKAYLMFADIDHLKEINDCFGHAAGDFAITTAADYLRHSMPANAVIARIGGDEYVALAVAEYEITAGAEVLVKRLEKSMDEFNLISDKPFYVEMSAGVYEFLCDENADISEILKKSDDVLYEEKKKRRATIKK